MNFRNQRLWRHLVADYTIIMSRTLKVTGNHVMYDHGAWLPRVIMSSSRALCCLSSVKKQKHVHSMFNKTIIRFGFVIFRIIKVSERVISLNLRLPPQSTLIILDITKTSSNNCLLFWRNGSESRGQTNSMLCDRAAKKRLSRFMFGSG